MLKLILAILTCILTLGAQQEIFYPKEYGSYAGNNALPMATAEYGIGKVSTVIADLPKGQYQSILLRPCFRFGTAEFDPADWTVEISISRETVSPERMIDYNSHNPNDLRVVMVRKIIKLPRTTSRFPNGGYDAIIAERVQKELFFDYPFINNADSNACIMFETHGWIYPYHKFDALLTLSNFNVFTVGSKSVFKDSGCDPLGRSTEYLDLVQAGQITRLHFEFLSMDYNEVYFFLGYLPSISPINLGEPGRRCFSYMDFGTSIMFPTSQLSLTLPDSLVAARPIITAQVMAFGEQVPAYVGQTTVLCPAPKSILPFSSRTMTNFMLNGPDFWARLFIVLHKS